jgi:hypothetical protein
VIVVCRAGLQGKHIWPTYLAEAAAAAAAAAVQHSDEQLTKLPQLKQLHSIEQPTVIVSILPGGIHDQQLSLDRVEAVIAPSPHSSFSAAAEAAFMKQASEDLQELMRATSSSGDAGAMVQARGGRLCSPRGAPVQL